MNLLKIHNKTSIIKLKIKQKYWCITEKNDVSATSHVYITIPSKEIIFQIHPCISQAFALTGDMRTSTSKINQVLAARSEVTKWDYGHALL